MKKKIISELRKNSRQTLKEISKKTEIPITTLFTNLRKLESKKLIRKHTTLVDFSKFGYTVAASIAIRLDKKERDQFKQFISTQESINSAYEIDSGYDFLIETIHKDHTDLKYFVEKMDESFTILEKNIYLMINTLHKEEFMAR